MWERGQVHRAQIVCQLAPKDAGLDYYVCQGQIQVLTKAVQFVSSAWLKRTTFNRRRKWTPSKRSEKEKARPQWMATPQHVHLRGRDKWTVLFSNSQCPMHHRLPCAMASSDAYGSKGTKRVGWRVGRGAYIALSHLYERCKLLDLQLGN